MTELRKRAMTWLQSCQTQTPTIEEVERLIHEVSKEYYAEGKEDGYGAAMLDDLTCWTCREREEAEQESREGYYTAMEIIDSPQ